MPDHPAAGVAGSLARENSGSQPLRILFVAMAESLHSARWLGQLTDQGWDLHLFPSRRFGPREALRAVTVHSPVRSGRAGLDASVRERGLPWPLPRGRRRLANALERCPGDLLKPAVRLSRLIHRLRPDIVHSLEMQSAGYLTLAAKRLVGSPFPKWIYSSWGSDLYYFGRMSEHEPRIRAVLAECDYLITDCERDQGLARELGFRGKSLGVFPGPGGFDLEEMWSLRKPGPVAARPLIMVKASHESWAGRTRVAVEALARVADQLRPYEVVFYSNEPLAARTLDPLSQVGVRCAVLPPSPHQEILKRLGRARVALAVNVSDGTPNTMLEAMVMGALPVQSDTVSTREWISDGENGLLVPPEDVDAVEHALRRALSDDELVERAAELNGELTACRIAYPLVAPRVVEMYRRVAVEGKVARYPHADRRSRPPAAKR